MNKHAQELAKLGRGKKKTLSTHERRRRRLWAKNLHVYREKKKKCSNVNKRKGKMMRVDKQKGFMNETPPTFDIESLLGQAEFPPRARGQRWFLRHRARTYYWSGFVSKESASEWIDHFGESLDWRVGFVFKLKGVDDPYTIVNRRGLSPK